MKNKALNHQSTIGFEIHSHITIGCWLLAVDCWLLAASQFHSNQIQTTNPITIIISMETHLMEFDRGS